MVYVIQVCRQISRRVRMELQFHPDPAFIITVIQPTWRDIWEKLYLII
jgi:hypothetical protein